MTANLLEQAQRAATHLDERWDGERAATVRAQLERRGAVRRRRRRLGRAALVFSLAALLVGLVGAFIISKQTDVEVAPIADGTTFREIKGSSALRRFELDRGSAWFTVAPDRSRTVQVRAGVIEVEVIGTRFLVEHQARGVRVVVDHGRVRVHAPGRAPRELGPGDDTVFEREAEVTSTPPVQTPPVTNAAEISASPLAPVRPRNKPSSAQVVSEQTETNWRHLAEQGDFVAAWPALQAAGPVTDAALELLLAADVARLSDHPAEATSLLRRLVVTHPTDARAPLAAFTLGRILLDELGQPREAAAAFKSVRTLEPSTPLAEDALAREVEALHRADEPLEARARANEYVTTYPAGRRLRAVRHYGGIE